MGKSKGVHVSYPKGFDTELSSKIEQVASAITKQVDVERYGEKILASSGSLMSAVVIYLIASPFVNSFLEELGAAAARSLKSLLVHVIGRVRRKGLRSYAWDDRKKAERLHKKQLTRKELNAQLKRIGTPNPPVAIRCQLETWYGVDFIFPDDITAKDAGRALSSIAEILASRRTDLQAAADCIGDFDANLRYDHYEYVFRNNKWNATSGVSRSRS
jgi:hypothetical protein